MVKKCNPPTNLERRTSHLLPHWELRRQHRRMLDQRVRSVRRYLFAGGVIGTVAFSALAGYETKGASTTADPTPTTESSRTYIAAASFFADQASTSLAVATASPTATTTTTSTLSAASLGTTSVATAPATATATATVAPTATEVPTATATPAEEATSASSDTAPPQTHSQTHSSN